MTRRPFAWSMAILTVVYLAFELGFNARLLDVTGVGASHGQVRNIEYCGRVISGVAVTLALWGMCILPRAMPPYCMWWSRSRLVATLAFSAALAIATVFVAEGMIVDVIVDRSSGEVRRAAAHLRVLSSGLLHGTVAIDGMDLTQAELAAPAGKAFLSMFPFAALVTPDLGRKTDALMRSAVRNAIDFEVGGPDGFYAKAFRDSVKALRDDYNAYAEGDNAYEDALEGIPRRQEDAWNRYVADMQSRTRMAPRALPHQYWPRALASVRAQGVQVPDGWQPGDRAAFNAAVARSVQSGADAQFRSRAVQAAGAELPHRLQWAEFLALSAVQSRWRQALGAPPKAALAADMKPAAVERDVYVPWLERETEAKLATLLASPASFADGGPKAVEGRQAMEALVVPPIALGFSLVGALVHVFKALNYLSECVIPRQRFRTPSIAVAVIALAVSAFFLSNTVSASTGFGYFERNMRVGWGVFGWPFSVGVRWAVQAQPWFYPVNETVRTRILFGLGYGYQPTQPSS